MKIRPSDLQTQIRQHYLAQQLLQWACESCDLKDLNRVTFTFKTPIHNKSYLMTLFNYTIVFNKTQLLQSYLLMVYNFPYYSIK